MKPVTKLVTFMCALLFAGSFAVSAPRCDLVTGECFRLNAGDACKIKDDGLYVQGVCMTSIVRGDRASCECVVTKRNCERRPPSHRKQCWNQEGSGVCGGAPLGTPCMTDQRRAGICVATAGAQSDYPNCACL